MGAFATSDTDNNTLYTTTTLHDKRAPHATATLPPPQGLKQVWRRTDGRAQVQNITSPAGRLADYKKILFGENNFDLTWCWKNKKWPEVTGQVKTSL